MKVIDLLNKIANGEEVPKKIKFKEYDELLYFKGDYDDIDEIYCYGNYQGWFDRHCIMLNYEIKIIEEPKKIEKITWKEKESLAGIETQKIKIEILARRSEKIKKSLNEIIDYINSKED